MMQEFEEFSEALPDPVLIVDRNRNVIGSNSAARKLFAGDPFCRKELVGDFVTLLRDPAAIPCIEKVLAGGIAESVRILLPVPVRITLKVHAAPLQDLESGDAGCLVTLRDVSDIVETEKIRNDFVANVSHELRSPLTVLSGMIETLQDQAKEDPESWPKLLSIMEREADRMVRLVDDLLSLSRVSAREHQQPTEPIYLQEILHETLTALGDQILKGENILELSLPEKSCRVLGSREELRQVFRNLIENAFKYGKSKSTVQVTIDEVERIIETGDRGYVVCVTDEGEGIAAEHIPRLTERFYRVDKSRSREKGGTGLGLAIVKHVVNRHRGRLVIKSEIGKGSTFAVHLPRLQNETPSKGAV